MKKQSEELRKLVKQMRKEGKTFWEISQVLKISPQHANYLDKT